MAAAGAAAAAAASPPPPPPPPPPLPPPPLTYLFYIFEYTVAVQMVGSLHEPPSWDGRVAATLNSSIALLSLGMFAFPRMLGKLFLAASFPSFIISRVDSGLLFLFPLV